MKGDCWFYIDSYVHISIKKTRALLYNSFTGKFLEFHDEPELIYLFKQLLLPKNVGVIRIKAKNLESLKIKKGISLIRKFFMGDLIEVSQSQAKPMQVMPLINVQNDVVYLKKDKMRSVGENIIDYLKQVTFFINDTCYQNCESCLNLYKQINCCYRQKNVKNELSIHEINQVLVTAENSLELIGFSGGDIFKYSKFENLVTLLHSYAVEKVLYLNYAIIKMNLNRLKTLEYQNIRLEIAIFFPMDFDEFRPILLLLREMAIRVSFVFIIQGQADFIAAKWLVTEHLIENFEYSTFYNGRNIKFFEKHLYTKTSDIEDNKPSMGDIYRNGLINSYHFGKFAIMPDGRVYASLVESSVGNIRENSIKDMLMKSLSQGNSWRRVRKNVWPCKACTFQNLCPPISSLNKIIGKNDLCQMNDKTKGEK